MRRVSSSATAVPLRHRATTTCTLTASPKSSTLSPTTSVRRPSFSKFPFPCVLTRSPDLIVAEGEEVVAASSMQRDPIVARVSELMRIEKMLTKSEIKAGKVRHVRERAKECLLSFPLRYGSASLMSSTHSYRARWTCLWSDLRRMQMHLPPLPRRRRRPWPPMRASEWRFKFRSLLCPYICFGSAVSHVRQSTCAGAAAWACERKCRSAALG